jgi:hypothetical protein
MVNGFKVKLCRSRLFGMRVCFSTKIVQIKKWTMIGDDINSLGAGVN